MVSTIESAANRTSQGTEFDADDGLMFLAAMVLREMSSAARRMHIPDEGDRLHVGESQTLLAV